MTQPPNIITLALRKQRIDRLLTVFPRSVSERLDAIASRMNGIPDAWLGAEIARDWAVGRKGP
jgi:hypothetical protein